MADDFDFSDDDDDLLNQACDEAEHKLELEEEANNSVISTPKSNPDTLADSAPSRSASPSIISCLKQYFGHSQFRPYQWEIVSACLNKRDQLVVMSTGYGKSVCYQLPALHTNKLTVVISPLLSLMEDQVINLRTMGVAASFLGSSQTESGRAQVMADLQDKKLRVLYVTPEYVSHATGNALLKQLVKDQQLVLLAIDEAHCISQWGHDFRESYRSLGSICAQVSSVPVMALTATATAAVRRDIVNNLRLKNPQITCTSFDRPNLFIEVKEKTNAGIEGDFGPLINEDGQRPGFGGPTIVYCQTRKMAELVNEVLRGSMGMQSSLYHAGLSTAARRKAHVGFSTDRFNVIVATVAFGMGIDKPDIRRVIHYGAPKDIESYYQEMGRAGRDGLPSVCTVIYSMKDFNLWRRFLSEITNPTFREHKERMQERMQDVLVTSDCRRRKILSYFEDGHSVVRGSVNCCDNCKAILSGAQTVASSSGATAISADRDFGKEAEMFFDVIKEVFREYSGFGKVIAFLRGSPSNHRHRWHGAGKDRSEKWWKAFAQMLKIAGYFTQRSLEKFMTVIGLSVKANMWLRNSKQPLLLRPSRDLLSAEQPTKPQQHQNENKAKRLLPYCKVRVYKNAKDFNITVKEQNGAAELSKSENVQKEIKLYNELLMLRSRIAQKFEISPYMVVSNKALQELSRLRPSDVASLCSIDDLPAERANRRGKELVDFCVEFCRENELGIDVQKSKKSETESLPSELSSLYNSLPQSKRRTYELFTLRGQDIQNISRDQMKSESLVFCDLADAAKVGLPLDLERLGLETKKLTVILNAVRSCNSDISDLTHILEKLPKDLCHNCAHLSIAVSIFEYEYGLSQLPAGGALDSPRPLQSPTVTASRSVPPQNSDTEPGSKRKLPSWLTSDNKSRSMPGVQKKKSKLRL